MRIFMHHISLKTTKGQVFRPTVGRGPSVYCLSSDFVVCGLTALRCLQTPHSWAQVCSFKPSVRLESEAQTRLPLFSRLLCFCGSFASVFSCPWLSVTFWRPGSECSMREWARVYTKGISTDRLELTEDTGSGSNFKKSHAEPVTQGLRTLKLSSLKNVDWM